MSKKNRNSSTDRELRTFESSKALLDREQTPDKIKFTPKDLVAIQPITDKQRIFFSAYDKKYTDPSNNEERDVNILCSGVAGCGKTLIALHKALEEVITHETKQKIIIIRSVVETRDRGFLPGTEEDKEAPFELPYIKICDELINYQWRNYERLKKIGLIEFETTSNLRGITLKNAVIIVDEAQNLNFHELDTVITRVGHNSRIIFCGDFVQSDLIKNKHDQSGLIEFESIIKTMPSFETIEFDVNDIVRSGLVKEYILARNKYKK